MTDNTANEPLESTVQKSQNNGIIGVGVKALLDDTVYYGLVIILVGASSFGLGRLSVMENKPFLDLVPINQTATAVISEKERVMLDPATTTAQAETTNSRYVGSKNSDKYHLPWCSGAQRIAEANKVYFATKADAEAAGYTPAANCKGL